MTEPEEYAQDAAEARDVQVEEVTPLEMIAALEADLKIARVALKRISRINPSALPGGPNNQSFGNKTVVALLKAREMAAEAYTQMTTEGMEDD